MLNIYFLLSTLRRWVRGLNHFPAKEATLLWGPLVRIQLAALKAYVLQNIQNIKVNILIIASLQAGSYEVFPKSSKETSKVCLVIADRVNRDIN